MLYLPTATIQAKQIARAYLACPMEEVETIATWQWVSRCKGWLSCLSCLRLRGGDDDQDWMDAAETRHKEARQRSHHRPVVSWRVVCRSLLFPPRIYGSVPLRVDGRRRDSKLSDTLGWSLTSYPSHPSCVSRHPGWRWCVCVHLRIDRLMQ